MLDHSSGAVDLSYARDGMPFLLDHNQRVQVGIVEDVTLDGDKKIRGMVRMGNHPDASWVEKDLRAGVRKKISVGYDPGANYEVIGEKGAKIPTRRYKAWKVYEASSVAVPADYDVGVARSLYEGQRRDGVQVPSPTAARQETNTMEGTSNTPTTPAAVGVGRDYDAERRERSEGIASFANLIADPKQRAEIITKALKEDWSPRQMADAVYTENVRAAAATVPAVSVDLSAKEQKTYSLTRAILSMVPGSGITSSFEREVSDALAKANGRDAQGIYIPLALSADRHTAAQMRAAVTGNVAGTTSLGGAGVASEVQDLIEILRNSTVVSQLGARFLPGLQGNQTFPRQITTNTWTWEGENPSTEKALTAATLETMTMSPKTGFGATAYSKQFLAQSTFSVEQFVREDLGMIAAIGIDASAISGSGSANQPTGILNLSGVETEVMGTHGGNLTWANLISYETKQSTNNADKGRLGFLTTPGVRGFLKKTLKNTVAGSDYMWGSDNTLNGYTAVASNQMPSNLTKGTSTTICHGVAFGNWQELLVGTWGEALDVTINPYTYSKQGMVEVVVMAMVDVNARHPKSFVITKDVTV